MVEDRNKTDCQQIESAVGNSSLATAMAKIPSAIYRCIAQSQVTVEFISDAIADISGYPASDFIGAAFDRVVIDETSNDQKIGRLKSLRSIVHHQDREQVIKILCQSLKARKPYRLQYRIICHDGSIKWMYEKGQGVFTNSGELLCLDGAIFDISESKKTAVALQESEYRYYTLTKMSPVGIFRTDEEGNCLYANTKLCEIAGISLVEILGSNWIQLLHPHDRERVTQEWKQWMQQRLRPTSVEIFKSEYRFLHVDEKITWVLSQIVAEKNSRGELIGYVGTLTDITECKQIEAQLRQSEARNRALLNAIPDLIVMFDSEGTITECQGGKNRDISLFPGTAVGKKLSEILPPEIVQQGMLHVQRAIATKQVQTWEYQLPIAGKMRYQEARIIASDRPCSLTGNPEVVGIVRDISEQQAALRERKQAEAIERRLFTSLRQQAQIIDQIHDAVISTDLDGYITSWNKGAERLYGYTNQEALGQHISFINLPNCREFLRREIFQPLIRNGNHELELQVQNKFGQDLQVHVSLSLLKNNQGAITGMIGYAIDITARKQTEAELRQSETRNRAFLKAIPDLIFRLNKQGVFLDFSAENRDELIYPDGSFLGKNVREIFAAQVAESTIKCINKALTTGKIQLFEYQLEIRPGERRAYEARIIKSVEDEVLVIIRNISARKQAEAALKESQARYKELAESISDVFFAMDKDLRYTYWNKASETLTGIVAGEAIGKTLYELFPDIRGTKSETLYLKVLSTGQPQTGVLEHQREGKQYFFEFRAYPSNNGGISVFVQDITGRKQAEAALKKSEQKLSMHVQQTPLAVIEWNLNFQVVEWNPAAENIFGYRKHEILGRSGKLLVAESVKPHVGKIFNDLLTQKGGTRNTNENITKEGKTIICDWYNTPLVASDGTVIGVASLAQDITDRKQTEQALRQQAQQERLVAEITQRMRQSLNLEEILNTAVKEIQKLLECDRVLVYRVYPEGTGSVISEAVLPNWPIIAGAAFSEEVFPEHCYEQYKNGQIRAVANIEQEMSPCLAEVLTPFGVKAKLIAPLIQGDFLWGLLIAHQCNSTREWQPNEIGLISHLANQLAIAIQQASLFEQLEAANKELKRIACLDGLTSVANRRYFDEYLTREWQRLGREQLPLALILCDIDYFKQYNDTYGHLAGDLCLQKIATAIGQAAKRPADLVARYGGEEFAIILPNTKAEGALSVAEEIQSYIKSLHIPHRGSKVSEFVTSSFGVAVTVPLLKTSPEQLILIADQALYEAKFQGRDRAIFKTFR